MHFDFKNNTRLLFVDDLNNLQLFSFILFFLVRWQKLLQEQVLHLDVCNETTAKHIS